MVDAEVGHDLGEDSGGAELRGARAGLLQIAQAGLVEAA